ncbi:hypothetical protein ACHHYP_08214 [Achlya hypogyna]|uniref:Protein kinase domain-containing protein n=1 Tax=Achlya hypogyna TaxID=1202772 RepID=A0A1V9ZLH7_ACHHY|nr:hypothetical protein ACHHYP_08214 [Achlya hypogyna]
MDSYVVQKRLSMAFYGDVVLALTDAGVVAIKRMDVAATMGHVSFQQHRAPTTKDFDRELEVYEYLSRAGGHRNIVSFVETFEHFGYHHLVLEHCGGGSLASAALPISQVGLLFTQLLDAICFLHSHGIAHGDIAASNVLMAGATFKLCDFGSAIVLANCTDDEAARHRLRDLHALGHLLAHTLEHATDNEAGDASLRQKRPAGTPPVLAQLIEFIRMAPRLTAMELLVRWQRCCSGHHAVDSRVHRTTNARRVFVDAL